MHRFGGHVLTAIGVLHLAVGSLAYAGPLAAIGRDRFFNAVDGHIDRDAAFWFMLTGLLLVLLGQLVRRAQRRLGTLPAFLGWSLLALSAVGALLMPFSGFWLLLVAAVLALAAARARGAGPAGPVATADPRSLTSS